MHEALSQQNISLIVGLGNPGKKYALTRHNVGYWVVDGIVAERGIEFHPAKGEYEMAEFSAKGRKIRLIKPLTYMNESGVALLQVIRRYEYTPEEILTITDDVNLPVGKIRVKRSGADGGHNGLKSVIDHLGSADFPRLRIGVGSAPAGIQLEDYVLGKPAAAEYEILKKAVGQAVELVYKAIYQGTDTIIGTYNIATEVE